MPYIKVIDRVRLEKLVKEMNLAEINSPGDLNYLITHLVHAYIGEETCYQDYNDALGALEGAKLELYRRYAVPYEDIKIRQNGDVP